jgi:uncharacterized repeat protein (TIGR03803 family)
VTKQILLLATIIAALAVSAGNVFAAKETVLYRFKSGSGTNSNGLTPLAGVVFDTAGNLYGTTSSGGKGWGIVFKLTPPTAGATKWTETVLYRFAGGADGADPQGPLAIDAAGNLYGVTEQGNASTAGTVFRLSPPAVGKTTWKETVLHRFSGGPGDGAVPLAGLVLDAACNLYGTTSGGGVNHQGTAFRLAPPAPGKTVWKETILYPFTGGADGGVPVAGLIFDRAGNLYGTTYAGGPSYPGGISAAGTVFELTPPAAGQTTWTETVLYGFPQYASGDSLFNGADPRAGVVFDGAGNLYGTTEAGGLESAGTVYELSPPAAGQTAWTETVLLRFQGSQGIHDGSTPLAGVIFDLAGNLYGTTAGGGKYYEYGGGTVFKLTLPHGGVPLSETIIENFNGNGPGPAGVVLDAAGNIYGTTTGDQTSNGAGTVFELTQSSGAAGQFPATSQCAPAHLER